MKNNYFFKITIFSIFLLLSTITYSQVNLYTQDFEGLDFDTYQLKNSGGTAVTFGVNGSDYIQKAEISTLQSVLGNQVTGFSGNVIALEDHDGAGFFGTHSIDTSPIDITGASGLLLKIRIAAPRGGDGNRYEVEDFLQVQIAIDGSAFQTVISAGGNAVNRNFYYDSGMDGINVDGNDVLVNQNSQVIDVMIPGSGASLVVRVLFDSQGSQEEILFDDIIVDAMSTLSTNEFALNNVISVYPNPSNGNIIIKNSGVALNKVMVTDVNGRLFFTQNLNGITTNKNLDLSTKLSLGLYFMTLSTETASVVKKIIIK